MTNAPVPLRSCLLLFVSYQVGAQFRDSLNLLMRTLNNTDPHYVRCIKPNDEKQAFSFNPVRTQQQLKGCGVLETIHMSAAGYPSRLTYREFLDRYRVLMKTEEVDRNDPRGTAKRVIRGLVEVCLTTYFLAFNFVLWNFYFYSGAIERRPVPIWQNKSFSQSWPSCFLRAATFS